MWRTRLRNLWGSTIRRHEVEHTDLLAPTSRFFPLSTLSFPLRNSQISFSGMSSRAKAVSSPPKRAVPAVPADSPPSPPKKARTTSIPPPVQSMRPPVSFDVPTLILSPNDTPPPGRGQPSGIRVAAAPRLNAASTRNEPRRTVLVEIEGEEATGGRVDSVLIGSLGIEVANMLDRLATKGKPYDDRVPVLMIYYPEHNEK